MSAAQTQSSASSPRVVAESVPASSDVDRATRQTVEKMCGYIRSAAADPAVIACADYAWRHFGMSLPSPAMKAWAVFWWVKHSIKFRSDEATMFRVGLADEQDLLIDPSVLVRMADPAEDCDGFTMLGSAMLRVLGVPVAIVTVAADQGDRSRWSHVFPVALMPTGILPLDMSHGAGPGWMVPREHIFRWQAWDLDGKPVSLSPQRFQGLHGYVRMRRGMGQCDPTTGLDDTGSPCVTVPPSGQMPTETTLPVIFSPPVSVYGGAPAPAPAPASPSPWLSLAAGAQNLLARLVTPPAYQQVTRDAYGNVISTTVRNATGATAFTAGAGSLASPMLWIVGGVGVLLLVSMMGSRSR